MTPDSVKVSDEARELIVSREHANELESVRLAAIEIVSWLYSPGAVKNGLLEAVAEVSGVHANHIVFLAEVLGVTEGEWPDEDRWITRPADPLWLTTQQEEG